MGQGVTGAKSEPVVTALARRLYEAYCDSFGWEDPYMGEQMVSWGRLSEGKKWRWRQIAVMVLFKENPVL